MTVPAWQASLNRAKEALEDMIDGDSPSHDEKLSGAITWINQAVSQLEHGDVERELEVMRYERDLAQARFENAVKKLTAIYGLLNPTVITAVEGKRYAFVNPNANDVLQALSDEIRSIDTRDNSEGTSK